MKNFNPKNERIKRLYFEYQKEANQKSESTVDNIRRSITQYEKHTKYQDLSTFNKEKAIQFKKYLTERKAKKSNTNLSKSTIFHTLKNIQDFFRWLSWQNGFKSKIRKDEIDYFNLSEKDTRIAKTSKYKEHPTIEQIKKVISSMSYETDIQKRNRALIAFILLSGMRVTAITSLRLKHIDVEKQLIKQDPEEVKTKFSKRIDTYFFPVGDEIKEIVVDWIEYLYKDKLFNDDAPVFPRTKLINKDNSFISDGIEPLFWDTAGQIRKIVKDAFIKAGLRYYSPHTFRNTLAIYGEKICETPEQFKAWSQNFGHERVLTTFNSYGTIETHRQGEIIKNINNIEKNCLNEKKLNKIIDILKSSVV